MTKLEILNAIEVMQAYIDGKTIESSQGCGWKEVKTPNFNFNAVKYRIKKMDAPMLDFGRALDRLKAGHKVARYGWNGKGMFIFLVQGSVFKVNRPPLLGIYPEGTEINYHAHIDMRTADNKIVPWLSSQTDVLAEDWIVVE